MGRIKRQPFITSALYAFILLLAACRTFIVPKDIKVAQPSQAVADARQLILECRKLRKEQEHYPEYLKKLYPHLLKVSELPESLKIPELQYASVYEDHLELVLARNPDWEGGLRIWSTDTERKHTDRPTQYPDMFFFEEYN